MTIYLASSMALKMAMMISQSVSPPLTEISVGWIDIKSGTDSHGPQRFNPAYLSNSLIFHPAPPLS